MRPAMELLVASTFYPKSSIIERPEGEEIEEPTERPEVAAKQRLEGRDRGDDDTDPWWNGAFA